ncbi:MAG TPA: (2Fe-2S)-binding protein [Bacteroidales bacterium]|nr:(2Fe-2S)-binding protein [Bacteroidales bacterium]HOK74963.1 (2Fe-2S)-binding protein [Bacteroidales bacterium]HOM41014.1 (2Fe-2S)-binding protein [Bacteroidales bacterium]HPP92613.1 (2Fe-2S)-binding protein [Bacteroidales bacterium]HQG57356.1 (2Fe-2S)-binding protein [Bacteroidales bacterium]
MEKTIQFTLNGKKTSVTIDPGQNLLWVLRNHFGLTGTKFGCGIGFCGACTILIDNEAVRSCQLPVSEVEGKNVLTIEGLAVDGKLHPLQQAFVDNEALQCGFCTPGMIMNALALLKRNSNPTRQQIIEAMDDNLCRCGAHVRIIKAIEDASVKMRGGK